MIYLTPQERILDEMKNRKLTQKDLAESCDVSVGYVNKLVSENCDITNSKGIRELINVAKKLDVSIDYLLGLSDVKGSDLESKNIEYISRYTGLTIDNVKLLHDVNQNELIEYEMADAYGCHNDELLGKFETEKIAFLNSIVHFSLNQYETSKLFSSTEDLLNSVKIIEGMSEDNYLFYVLSVNSKDKNISKAIQQKISPNFLSKGKSKIDLSTFNLSNDFIDILNNLFKTKDVITRYESIIKFVRNCDDILDNFEDYYEGKTIDEWCDEHRSVCIKEIQEIYDQLGLGKYYA